MMSELQNEKNPFTKDLILNTNDKSLCSELYLNCLKSIPKIGEKNAQIILKKYKSIKQKQKLKISINKF